MLPRWLGNAYFFRLPCVIGELKSNLRRALRLCSQGGSISRTHHDLLTRREAIAAMGALACVKMLDSCGGSPTAANIPIPPPVDTTPTAKYAVTGDWIPPVFLTETVSGRSLPYQLFIPKGATPSVALPLVMHVNGHGQRGASGSGFNDPSILIASGAGLASVINSNKLSVPQAFYLFPMQAGGPDPAGERYARNFYSQAVADVLAKYNIDRSRMHLSGYSAGAVSIYGYAYRFPKIFASLTLWDGLPSAWTLTNEMDAPSNPGSLGGTSDLLSPATYPSTNNQDQTNTPAARAQWARVVGDIPLNYQHGALDAHSFSPGPIPSGSGHPNGQEINDYVVRGNDPLTSPNLNTGTPSWFSTFPGNGQTAPTTVTAATNPSPSYSPTLKHVYVPYGSYDHGALNTSAFALNNPWWNWWQARVRSDYV